MRHSLAIALLLTAGVTARASAQGTLSTQGFGYPPGQISTHAASLGGGLLRLFLRGVVGARRVGVERG